MRRVAFRFLSPFRLAIALVAVLSAIAATRAQAQGTGVYGEYFNNDNFVADTPPRDGERIDGTINFNWGNAVTPGPDALPPGITGATPAVAWVNWTARWSGLVQAPVTGFYTFQTVADDGVRVWVDGRLVIDRWRDQSVTTSSPQGINLVGGQSYGLRVEFFQNPGDATVSVQWQVPGSGVFVVVPQSALYSTVAAPKISPAGGTYSDSVTVTMSVDTYGAEIRYTTDGSTPTAASTLYAGPFVVTTNTPVNAIGFRPGTLLNPSAMSTAAYTVSDVKRPTIATAQAPIPTQVVVVFSEAVDPTTAQNAGNYSMSGTITVASAVLSGDLKTVFLTTTAMTPGNTYTLTVNNVTDRATPAHAILAGSSIDFVFPNFPTAVHYYPFEEGSGTTTLDLGSAASNPNTFVGATSPPTWIIGYLGRALSFGGIDGAVSVADLNSVLGGTATLACWVRTQGQGNIPVRAPGIAGGILGGNATSSNDIFWGWLDENGRIGVTMGTTVDFASNPEPVPPNPQTNSAQSANPINDGQWHHVAFTRDSASGALQVYVDGFLSGTGTGQMGALTAACTEIGHITNAVGSAGYPIYFLGDLDDLRIYGTVLTTNQIQSLANRAPLVDAGPDQSVQLGAAATLSGTVSDDGFPTPSTITVAWSGTGPGAVAFANASALSTTATFGTPGVYVLKLSASDGQLTSSDTMTVSYGLVTVSPLSIVTDYTGTTASFSVVLNVAPTASVTIAISSSNTAVATVSPPSLTFAAAGAPQIVTVTGVDNGAYGAVPYTIVTGACVSADPAYNGFDPADVAGVTNEHPLPELKKVWGCGSTGAEVLIVLGLAGFLRRRRRAK